MKYIEYLNKFNLNEPVIDQNIVSNVQNILKIKFPNDYIDFIISANGGVGIIGERNYLILWRIEDLPSFNKEYCVDEFANGLVLFGSNGGGEAFAFNTLNQMKIVSVPFVGMDVSLAIEIADNFNYFINFLAGVEL